MENTNKDLINRFLFASNPLVSSFKEISHCMHFLSFAWIFIQMPHCGTWERASKRSDVACERATLPVNVLTLPANVRRCLRTCDVACKHATLPANVLTLPANARTLPGYLAREFWFLSRILIQMPHYAVARNSEKLSTRLFSRYCSRYIDTDDLCKEWSCCQ